MPADRHVQPRRSRRLSQQCPRSYIDGSGDFPQLQPFSEVPSPPSLPLSPFSLPSPTEPPKRRARQRTEGHIPRPPNAFILFRSSYWAKMKSDIVRMQDPDANDHRVVSCKAAKAWHALGDDGKAPFIALAAAERSAHAEKFPTYRYSPTKGATTTRRKRAPRGPRKISVRKRQVPPLLSPEPWMAETSTQSVQSAVEQAIKVEEQQLTFSSPELGDLPACESLFASFLADPFVPTSQIKEDPLPPPLIHCEFPYIQQTVYQDAEPSAYHWIDSQFGGKTIVETIVDNAFLAEFEPSPPSSPELVSAASDEQLEHSLYFDPWSSWIPIDVDNSCGEFSH